MINIFNIDATDRSIQYLQQIFGSMSGVISSSAAATGGSSITILGTMFKSFNTVILAVATLMVVYITVVGVLKSGHEGEFMGRGQWSALWIPIRVVLGIGLLVPSGEGYSGIQYLLMWVVVQGIGAANYLWNTSLNYVNYAGSVYAQSTIPSAGVNQALGLLFQAMACDATARETRSDPFSTSGENNGGGYYCNINSKSGWCKQANTMTTTTSSGQVIPIKFDPSKKVMPFGPNGMCGQLRYCDVSEKGACKDKTSIECAACTGQIEALNDIVPTLYVIASDFEKADYTYRDFYARSYNTPNNPDWQWIYNYCAAQSSPIAPEQCCIATQNESAQAFQTCQASVDSSGDFPSPNLSTSNGSNPQSPSSEAVKDLYWLYYPQMQQTLGEESFINTAVSYYLDKVTGAVTTFMSTQAQNPNNELSDTLKEAQSRGWMFAGAYYNFLANQNDDNMTNSIPDLQVVSQSPDQTKMGGYRNNYSAAAALMSASKNASGTPQGSLSSNAQTEALGDSISSAVSDMQNAFQKSSASTSTEGGKTQTNPLIALEQSGFGMILSAEILFSALLLTTIGLGLAGYITFFVLGTGAPNPAGPTFTMIYFFLVPLFLSMMGMMISLGGMLSVYVPLIPYVIFTFGVISWFITTIEAMVAGPIVTIGVLNPSGQSELFGSAGQALMLIFNIFLRPSLMIFGLIAAMLLATVVVDMINDVFWGTVVPGIGAGAAAGGPDSGNKAGSQNDPVTLMIFLCAYVMLIIAALNKCFAAIYLIPQQVIRWIGGQPEAGGAEGTEEVRKGTEAGAGGASGAVTGSVGHGKQAGAEGKAHVRENKEKEAEKGTESPDVQSGGQENQGEGPGPGSTPGSTPGPGG